MNIDHQPTLVDEASLVEIVSFVWPVLFDTEIETAAPRQIDHGVTASISIGGAWTATLVVSLEDELASRSAAALLDMDVAELDEESLRDAIGEIANVVGGNVKGLLDDAGEPTLSLPVVARADQTVTGGHVTIRAGFQVDGLNMTWQLHERV